MIERLKEFADLAFVACNACHKQQAAQFRQMFQRENRSVLSGRVAVKRRQPVEHVLILTELLAVFFMKSFGALKQAVLGMMGRGMAAPVEAKKMLIPVFGDEGNPADRPSEEAVERLIPLVPVGVLEHKAF
jgi:hypothetical protein